MHLHLRRRCDGHWLCANSGLAATVPLFDLSDCRLVIGAKVLCTHRNHLSKNKLRPHRVALKRA